MMTAKAFGEQAIALGLCNTAACSSITSLLPSEKRDDAQVVAKLFVERGVLTKYQAAALYQGKGKSLVYGEYVILDRIGAGGVGQVYKARHKRMDRVVALKILSATSMKNADAVRRFDREVRAAAKLMHQNIVTALDAGVQDGVHYLVSEFVDGPDLATLFKKQGRLTLRQACNFVAQAARGLAFAHAKGVVHRDIKPGNLLVDHEGTIKVLDMGLARFEDGPGTAVDDELTQNGSVLGTVNYMAPEQARNTSEADAKSDVYSLGCTLYRLLTGESVFGGRTMVEKILAHREQPIPSLQKVRPDAPSALEMLVSRMLAKQPTARPTMQEIVDALVPMQATIPSSANEPALAELAMVIEGEKLGETEIGSVSLVSVPVGLSGDRPRSVAVRSARKRRGPEPIIAASIAVVAVLGGVWFAMRDKGSDEIARNEVSPAAVTSTIPPQRATPSPSAVVRATAPFAPVAIPSTTITELVPATTQTAATNFLSPKEIAANSGTSKMFALPTAPVVPSPISSTTTSNAAGAGATPTAIASATQPTFTTPIAVATPTAGPTATADATLEVASGPAAAVTPSESTNSIAKRTAVPDDKKQQAALALIKDVYKDDYTAARAPDKKAAFADKLLQQAKLSADEVERFVLLSEARTLAVDGGDASLLHQALAGLVGEFDIDATATAIDSWKALLTKPRPAVVIRSLFDEAAARMDEAIVRAEFDNAKRFGDFAVTLSPRFGDTALTKSARDRVTALAAREQEWEAVQAAVKTLTASSDDADANFVVGRYRGVAENDWLTAFKLLSKGSDATWQALAEQSNGSATDANAQATIGDAWWEASQAAKTGTKSELMAAAAYWYQSAMPTISGLVKVRVEKRLADATAAIAKQKIPATKLDLPASIAPPPPPTTLASGDGGFLPVRGFGDPKPGPLPPSAVSGKPVLLAGASSSRAIAERLFPFGAHIRIADGSGARFVVKSPGELPAGNFDITEITNVNFQKAAGQFGDADLQVLSALANLSVLDLRNSQIAGPGLAYLKLLTSLRDIGLARSPMTDAGCDFLAQLPNLTSVSLESTEVTDAGIAKLQHLVELKDVHLKGTRVTDASAPVFKRWTHLTRLTLDETFVGDATVEAIASAANLNYLSLKDTKVTDRCVPSLLRLKSLKTLILVGTNLSAPSIDSLRKEFGKGVRL